MMIIIISSSPLPPPPCSFEIESLCSLSRPEMCWVDQANRLELTEARLCFAFYTLVL